MPLAVHQGSNSMGNLTFLFCHRVMLICFSDQNHSGRYCLEGHGGHPRPLGPGRLDRYAAGAAMPSCLHEGPYAVGFFHVQRG